MKGKLVDLVKVIMMEVPCRSLLTNGRISAYSLGEIWVMEFFEQRSNMIQFKF